MLNVHYGTLVVVVHGLHEHKLESSERGAPQIRRSPLLKHSLEVSCSLLKASGEQKLEATNLRSSQISSGPS